MKDVAIEMTSLEVVESLAQLRNGKIDDAMAGFVEEFTFTDHGFGLEFRDKERLSEFFRKTRELYPDSSLRTDKVFVSGDHVILEWTLQTMLTEPFYGGLSRQIKVISHGASCIQLNNGKITEWTDYYDGLTSRRTALAEHFTEWFEL